MYVDCAQCACSKYNSLVIPSKSKFLMIILSNILWMEWVCQCVRSCSGLVLLPSLQSPGTAAPGPGVLMCCAQSADGHRMNLWLWTMSMSGVMMQGEVQLTPHQSRSEVVFISKCDRVPSVNRVNTTLPCLPVSCKQLSSELEQAASCHITTTGCRHHHMFRALMLLLLIQSIQVHCTLVCQQEIINKK